MKTLSRDEMKKVMGGNSVSFEWRCFVSDGSPTGGAYYNYCGGATPPSQLCTDTSNCTMIGTCTYSFGCINY